MDSVTKLADLALTLAEHLEAEGYTKVAAEAGSIVLRQLSPRQRRLQSTLIPRAQKLKALTGDD